MIGTTNSNYHGGCLSMSPLQYLLLLLLLVVVLLFTFPSHVIDVASSSCNGRLVKYLSSTTTVITITIIAIMSTMIGLELHYLRMHPKKYPLRNVIPLRY